MRSRLALALAAAALGACASYAAQRLIDRAGEPPQGAVLLQAWIPFYWRAAIASLHALVLGSAVFAALDEARAARALARLEAGAPWLVVACALAMAVWP